MASSPDFLSSRAYEERVYAGVLGKIIGVYLGRPIEGWSHERIEREMGEVDYYVHEKRGVPLVVTDDDISGTFTFVAALEAQAFTQTDLDTMLDTAVTLIPRDSTIYRLIGDIRGWAGEHGEDWRATLRKIQAHYGYDKFGGACHMVPNHGVILLALV